jgi:hypothetical protein
LLAQIVYALFDLSLRDQHLADKFVWNQKRQKEKQIFRHRSDVGVNVRKPIASNHQAEPEVKKTTRNSRNFTEM